MAEEILWMFVVYVCSKSLLIIETYTVTYIRLGIEKKSPTIILGKSIVDVKDTSCTLVSSACPQSLQPLLLNSSEYLSTTSKSNVCNRT